MPTLRSFWHVIVVFGCCDSWDGDEGGVFWGKSSHRRSEDGNTTTSRWEEGAYRANPPLTPLPPKSAPTCEYNGSCLWALKVAPLHKLSCDGVIREHPGWSGMRRFHSCFRNFSVLSTPTPTVACLSHPCRLLYFSNSHAEKKRKESGCFVRGWVRWVGGRRKTHCLTALGTVSWSRWPDVCSQVGPCGSGRVCRWPGIRINCSGIRITQ